MNDRDRSLRKDKDMSKKKKIPKVRPAEETVSRREPESEGAPVSVQREEDGDSGAGLPGDETVAMEISGKPETAAEPEMSSKPEEAEGTEISGKPEETAKPEISAEPENLVYRKPKRSKKDRKNALLYMLPSLLGVLLFFVVPFFVVIYYAVIDNPIHGEFVFLDNFSRIIQNSSFQQAARNTGTFSLAAVPLAVVLSLAMAILLEQNIPMRSQFRTFVLSPMMVPVASIVLIWRVLFDYHGVVNLWLSHMDKAPIDWFKSSYSQIVIVILFLWKNLGYNMILFMAALNAIPKDELEVARLESASPLQIFWYIKLRYLSSTILFVAILSLINSFKVFREVYLLTGDYPYDTLYMLQHFMNNTFRSLDYQKLSSGAILMALVMVVVIGCLFLAEDRFGKDVEG